MIIKDVEEKGTTEQRNRLSQIRYVTRNAKLSDDVVQQLFDSKDAVEEIEKRYMTPPTEPKKEDPKEIEKQIEEARKSASKETKDLMDKTLSRAKKAGFPLETAFGWIKEGKSADEITDLLVENYKKADPKVDNTITVSEADIEKKKEGAFNAILHRACPSHFKDDPKNEFRGLSLKETAIKLAATRGYDLSKKTSMEIADKVFGQRDMSTLDLPLLLEEVANKMLREDYQGLPETWPQLGSEIPFSDFKDKNMYQLDSDNVIKEVKEGDEIKYGKLDLS